VLKVSAQHLYLDVKRCLDAFLDRLRTDTALQKLVEQNDERLLEIATKAATEGLEERDFIALAM
jgi:hypothetical protein